MTALNAFSAKYGCNLQSGIKKILKGYRSGLSCAALPGAGEPAWNPLGGDRLSDGDYVDPGGDLDVSGDTGVCQLHAGAEYANGGTGRCRAACPQSAPGKAVHSTLVSLAHVDIRGYHVMDADLRRLGASS